MTRQSSCKGNSCNQRRFRQLKGPSVPLPALRGHRVALRGIRPPYRPLLIVQLSLEDSGLVSVRVPGCL